MRRTFVLLRPSASVAVATANAVTRPLSRSLLTRQATRRTNPPSLIQLPNGRANGCGKARVVPSLIQGTRRAVPAPAPAPAPVSKPQLYTSDDKERRDKQMFQNGNGMHSSGHKDSKNLMLRQGGSKSNVVSAPLSNDFQGLNSNYPTIRVAQESPNKAPETANKEYTSDLVVVLDMDECLIHSQFLSSGEVDYDTDERYRQYESDRENHVRQSTNERNRFDRCASFRVSLPDGDLVRVNKRPHLDAFLQEISSRFETHVFTAAMEVYARPVLDVLDPRGDMLNERFYRESCVVDQDLGVYVKDLHAILGEESDGTKINGPKPRRRLSDSFTEARKFFVQKLDVALRNEPPSVNGEEEKDDETSTVTRRPFNERRVVLVDNNPLSFLANPSNGILVSNFYDDPEDETLPAVIELLDQLDGEDDVRPMLDDMFGLKDALKEVINGAGGKRRGRR